MAKVNYRMGYQEAKRCLYDAIVDELEYNYNGNDFDENDYLVVGFSKENGEVMIGVVFNDESRFHFHQVVKEETCEEYALTDIYIDGEINSDKIDDIVDEWVFECDFH